MFLTSAARRALHLDTRWRYRVLAATGRRKRSAAPTILAPFVGAVEIGCGSLLIEMVVAISTTKVPILLSKGFWTMAHEAGA